LKPLQIVTLDFETAFSTGYTLTSLSTSDYVRDPRFKAHMVGIRIDDAPAVWYAHEDIPDALARIDWANAAVLAHNCAFDGFILSHVYGIVPGRGYLDTLSMSRALFGASVGHRLDDVAQRLGVGAKLKGALENTKGKTELTDEELEHLGDYCCMDVDLCYEVYKLMVDHLPPDELEVIDLTLAMFCDPVLELDHQMIERAIELEKTKKVVALLSTSSTKEWLMSNEKFAELLRRHGVDPPLKVSKTTGKLTYAFAKTDAGFRELLKHPNEDVRELAEARKTVKSTIVESRAERLKLAGANGWKVPVLLNYCGAHTTRWSGGNKMNMQNLPRPEFDLQGNIVEDTGLLRRSLMAPEGHVLVVADASQIEVRITAWLCQQWDLIEDFRAADLWDGTGTKPDVYKKFASLLYGKPVELITKEERFIAKTCILGLGYGMGAVRFQESLEAGLGGPPVFLPIEECYAAVDFYRRKHHRIKQGWKDMGALLAHMSKPPKGGHVPELDYGPIGVGYGFLRLPNGLFMQYPEMEYDPGTDRYSYRARSGRSSIYGPKFLENIVQALSRTMIADNMVTLRREGVRFVMTTHDEVVAVTREDEAPQILERMFQVMKTPPAWAEGLPLNAEGGYSRRYEK
jgi:hypothetical protein